MDMNKYKIFDTESNDYAKDGDWSIGSQSGLVRGIYGEEFPKMKALQFTGIVDQYDIEIYADDIVTDGSVEFKTTWHTQQCRWWLEPIIDDAIIGEEWVVLVMDNQPLGSGYLRRSDLTVIGNTNFIKAK